MSAELSEFQKSNLLKLSRYLWDLPQERFGMGDITYPDTECASEHGCGSVGCAIGHGVNAGVKALDGEDWCRYWGRVFSQSADVDMFLFCGSWDRTDNTPRGASKRILYYLRHGVPEDGDAQCYGEAPLSYLDEPLDLVEPKRETLTGVVELVKAAV